MVYLLPTSDQIDLSGQVADYLCAEFPVSRLRRDTSVRYDLAHWQHLVAYGFIGLGVDEAHGGSNVAVTDEALIFRQLGRALVSPAILASAVAARIAIARGNDAVAAGLIDGSRRAGLAFEREAGSAHAGLYLIDSEAADFVLVATTGKLRLFSGDALNCESADSFDDGVSLQRAMDPPDVPILEAGGDSPFTTQFVLFCAAQLVGISEHARDLTLDYAKIREQFGRPIGSFQAIKHRCADMEIRSQVALAQFYRAAVTCRDNAADSAFHAAASFRLASRAALQNAAAAIQLHGGIGFTAECDAHWLLKRAHLLNMLNISPLAGVNAFLHAPLAMASAREASHV
jgi:alkylation response protein AidB-like acyl-CoA dehydrogenase